MKLWFYYSRKSRWWLSCLFIVVVLVGCDQSSKTIKVATYNIYFLDDGISPERKANLLKVIELLDADIIGFQEIENPAALENVLPPSYEIAMLDDPGEVQELAIAVRSPLKIMSAGYVFPDTSLDEPFPRTRDLLQVVVDAYGTELVTLVHHAKSRRGGRMETDSRREEGAWLMVEYVRSNFSAKPVIVMGDFNDNPDDRSLNILEYGDKSAPGGMDSLEDSFLFNTSEALLETDYCSYGYSYLFDEAEQDTFALTVSGARTENNKWRDREHDYFNDVQIKAILFDQILLSTALKPGFIRSGVFNHSVAVVGEPSRIRFEDGKLVYTNRGSLASDHVPVWAVLDLSKMQN